MLELTKDMLTGIPKVDEQHKELISMLNTAQSMGTQAFQTTEIKKTLDYLGNYVIKHFTDEESLQRQCKYPKHEWHRGQHQSFIADFGKLKNEFASNGASTKFSLSLNKSIVNWVFTHIKTADVEFGKYYKENR